MKRYIALVIVAIVLALIATFPLPAHAIDVRAVDSAGFDQLSETQKAEVLKKIAETAAENKAGPVSSKTIEKTAQWVDLGERFGKMIGGAAREVGVAVNEFIKTPVGMMTAALIVWHIMGGVIVHVLGGVFVVIAGFSMMWFLSRRLRGYEIVYDPEKKDIFGRSVKLSQRHTPLDSDWGTAFYVGGFLTILLSIAVTFTY